jgi:hypothetical protein
MAFTTIFILAPLALIASAIYSYLFFSRYKIFDRIKNKIIRTLLKIFSYKIVIIFLTYILTLIGMMLAVGIIGMPVLIILDIIGIILLIKKIITGNKLKKMVDNNSPPSNHLPNA